MAGSTTYIAQSDDHFFVEALRGGDETAFRCLIDRHHAAMMQVARIYVSEPAVAEEIVQETWLEVIRGLPRFEARSSIKTWIFCILANRARTRGKHEQRTIAFSMHQDGIDLDQLAHDSCWLSMSQCWAARPDEQVLWAEVRAQVLAVIAALPSRQRQVLILHDIKGWSVEDICDALGVTGVHQRVLLHRARMQIRRALVEYWQQGQD